MKLNDMTELHILVLRAADSNGSLADQHEAFCEIVRLFQDMAYACAYAVLGDFHLAEDVAQDAFISAWQKLYQLRQPKAFPAWFRRIVLTECNRLNRGRRLQAISLDDVRDSYVFADLQTLMEKDELSKEIFTAVGKLPFNQRVATLLFYVQEYSQKDISTFLEVPLTTVAKRLYSARMNLRGMVLDGLRTNLTARRPSRNETFAGRVKAGIYDEYVGEYKFDLRPALIVTITKEGDRLISEGGGQRNELSADNDSDNELVTNKFDGRGKFVRNERGRITHFIYYEFGCEMGLAQKIC
jgi:RNA polymerase sigma factor (sigma-70 family)